MSADIISRPAMNFAEKRAIAKRLLKEGYTSEDLTYRLAQQMRVDPMEAGARPLDRQTFQRLVSDPQLPDMVKRVLTSSATALVRQDLDSTLYALFVIEFPWWDRIHKEPANGLVHAYNQVTAPGSSTYSQITITELGNVADDTSTYLRQTTPIAVFATRRGISLKERYAVAQGGAPYDPEAEEVANGVITMSEAMQTGLFHGNATVSNTGTDAEESGLYNVNGIDGLRGIVGALGPYAGNNAIQLDIVNANFTLTQAVNRVSREILDNGRRPTVILGTAAALEQLLNEQLPQVRYNSPGQEIVPGVMVETVLTLAGRMPFVVIPGSFIGEYNRTSDSVLVDDVYVLDERSVSAPYLGADTFTTIEIPIGANAQLSRLFILFGMFGFAVKGPLWAAKIRRPV